MRWRESSVNSQLYDLRSYFGGSHSPLRAKGYYQAKSIHDQVAALPWVCADFPGNAGEPSDTGFYIWVATETPDLDYPGRAPPYRNFRAWRLS